MIGAGARSKGAPHLPRSPLEVLKDMVLRFCEKCAAEVEDVGGFCLLGHPLRLDPPIPSVSHVRNEVDRVLDEVRVDGSGAGDRGPSLPPPPPRRSRLSPSGAAGMMAASRTGLTEVSRGQRPSGTRDPGVHGVPPPQ